MVSKFTQPDYTSQAPDTYKAALDDAAAVLNRIAGAFAPHESAVPDMRVRLDPGFFYNPSTKALTELPAQNSSVITAPVTYPRVDRVCVNVNTGVVSVIAGTEDPAPTPPALAGSVVPVAQVLLTVGMTEITNADITDERVINAVGLSRLAQFEISDMTVLTAPVADDLLVVADTSAASLPKAVTLEDVFKVINLLDAETAPALADKLALYDASGAQTDAIELTHLLKIINLLTVDATPDSAADYVVTYDASAGAPKKVLLQNLGFIAGTPLVQSPMASGTVTQAHGLAGKPPLFSVVAECLTAENGYSIGDKIEFGTHEHTGSSSTAFQVYADATNVVLLNSGQQPNTANKSTRANGNLTLANWKLTVTPYYKA